MNYNNDFKYDLKVGQTKEQELGDIFNNKTVEVKTGSNKPIRYEKPLKEGFDTSNAMSKTYIFLAKKIIKQKI